MSLLTGNVCIWCCVCVCVHACVCVRARGEGRRGKGGAYYSSQCPPPPGLASFLVPTSQSLPWPRPSVLAHQSDGQPFTGRLTSSNPVSQTSSPAATNTMAAALPSPPVDTATDLIEQISILW